MKIALHQTGEIGHRAGQIILGDRRVETLGLIDRLPMDSQRGRVEQAGNLAGYDVVMTDDTDPIPTVRRAVAAGTSCAVWTETRLAGIALAETTVLVGANLATGITPCLASHEIARLDNESETVIAWTESGPALRSGEPLAFPDPVGGRWGRRFERNDPSRLVAPIPGEWAGALAKVTADVSGATMTRVVGVADLALHLEALALAAGTLALAQRAFGPGVVAPVDTAEMFLKEVIAAGLDIATYTTLDR